MENVNAQIDARLATGVLLRLLAMTELKFSNSMIEAWWRFEAMVTSRANRQVPTRTLAVLAHRLGTVCASPSTWYRLVRRHGWRRGCACIPVSQGGCADDTPG